MTTVFRVAVRHVSGKKNIYDVTMPSAGASFDDALRVVREKVPTAKVAVCLAYAAPAASAA